MSTQEEISSFNPAEDKDLQGTPYPCLLPWLPPGDGG